MGTLGEGHAHKSLLCVPMHVSAGARPGISVFLYHLSPIAFRQGLSQNLKSVVWIGWAASELLECAFLLLSPNSGVTGTLRSCLDFYVCDEDSNQGPHAHRISAHTHLAISSGRQTFGKHVFIQQPLIVPL